MKTILVIDECVIDQMIFRELFQYFIRDIRVITLPLTRDTVNRLLTREITPTVLTLDINPSNDAHWKFLAVMESHKVFVPTYLFTQFIRDIDSVESSKYENVKGILTKPITPIDISLIAQQNNLLFNSDLISRY